MMDGDRHVQKRTALADRHHVKVPVSCSLSVCSLPQLILSTGYSDVAAAITIIVQSPCSRHVIDNGAGGAPKSVHARELCIIYQQRRHV